MSGCLENLLHAILLFLECRQIAEYEPEATASSITLPLPIRFRILTPFPTTSYQR